MNQVVTRTNQYGDFQTPMELASQCYSLASTALGDHDVVIEPTCGEGTFLQAVLDRGQCRRIEGFEFQIRHVRFARKRLAAAVGCGISLDVRHQDFFSHDWMSHRNAIDGRVLYLGNPPWVTNAALGKIESTNLPVKSNFDQTRGVLAITGGGNFDLSESVLQTLVMAMRPGRDSLGMLVKTATVRKVAKWAWSRGFALDHLSMHAFDAQEHFGVNVDACWMMLRLAGDNDTMTRRCRSYPSLSSKTSSTAFGWHGKKLVAHPTLALKTKRYHASTATAWRSGVKHDAASVLVLTKTEGGFHNGFGKVVDVETNRVYPLAKGSDIANGRGHSVDKFILLPQRRVGESTQELRRTLPKTSAYLNEHAEQFNRRRSAIYRGRDCFAVFGIGKYTFANWKVAIAGLYKRLTFTLVGPVDGRPVILDDTTYSLGFKTRREASLVQRVLTTPAATDFFSARIFWDAKRPINAAVLGSIDLTAVATAIECHDEWRRCFGDTFNSSTFGQG